MRRTISLLLTGALLAWPAAARAQVAARDSSPPGSTRTLALTVFSGYDDDVLNLSEGVGGIPIAGNYVGLQARLSSGTRPGPFELSVNGGSAGRYFPAVRDLVTMHHDLSIGAAAKLGDRVRLSGAQTGQYAPHDLIAPAFGSSSVDGATAADYSPATRRLFTAESQVQLTTAVTQHSSMAIAYSYRHSTGDGGAMTMRSVSGEYTAQLGRSLGARLTYSWHATVDQRSSMAATPVHDIQFGIDYVRRRMRLLLASESSMLADDSHRRLDFGAHAALIQTIGRRWQSTVDYTRGLQFVEATGAPIFADALTASLDGSVARRVQLHAALSYRSGDIVWTATGEHDSALQTYRSVGRVGVRLHPRVMPYVEFSQYRHRFSEGLATGGWPEALSRQRIEAGVIVFASLDRGPR